MFKDNITSEIRVAFHRRVFKCFSVSVSEFDFMPFSDVGYHDFMRSWRV